LGVQIYSLDWSYRERTRIVSASQDGRLIVWNAISSQKTHAIKLPCAWVMACAFSPGGHAVACGGLDNVCSIFNLNSTAGRDGNLPLSCALVGHKGYLSCCRYVPDEEAHIITSSGDHTCIMWDAETNQRISLFGGDSGPAGHTSDVMRYSYRWGRW
jgi:guanine nucleotide-binding protein G(I)/G(S)/G(T) subunit beta-1